MGQLFDRANCLAKSELNFGKTGNTESYLHQGNALVAGGAIAGASIGKVGILAGGTGYAVGTIPLAALGALTGAALYEALRSLLEGDASAASTAAIGATAGAATSAVIGGVGVAAGGSAIGVGIASMAAGGAAIALGLVGLNRLFQQDLDPQMLLDRSIQEMETYRNSLRTAILNVVASQKEIEQHHERSQSELSQWEEREQLAVKTGDDYLALGATSRKNIYSDTLISLKIILDRGVTLIKNAEEKISSLEAKIHEAKIMRTLLTEKIAEAKLNGQLQNTTVQASTNSAMGAFECMEEKVLMQEPRSTNLRGNAASELEKQFTALEAGSDVDDELLQMKTILTYCSTTQAVTPVDEELEALRRQLNQ